MKIAHPYHLVDVSPWPLLMSVTLLFGALVVVSWLTHKLERSWYSIIAQINIILISYQWFRDVVREAQGGYHTKVVQRGILISFLIFLSKV